MKYENLMILFFLPLVFLGLFLLWFLHRWVCTNSSMDLPVHLLKTIRLQSSLDIFTEMWLVFLGFIFHQGLKNYCKQCQTVILNLHNNRHKKKPDIRSSGPGTCLHIGSNMATKDVSTVNISIKLLLVLVETSKPFITVRNIQTPIKCSLKRNIILINFITTIGQAHSKEKGEKLKSN